MRRVPPRPALIFVGCALVLPLTAASCGEEPSHVPLGSAARATVAEHVDAPGSVTARAAAILTAPAPGTVGALRVEAGDRVRKGQVVAVIDSPVARRRLADAEHAVRQARRSRPQVVGTADLSAARRDNDAEAKAAFAEARAAAAQIADPTERKARLAQITAAEKRYAASSKSLGQSLESLERGVAGAGQASDALASAQRLQAEQAYELADATVSALTLKAPVDGVVQLGGTAKATAPAASSISDLIANGSSSGTAGAAAAVGVDAAVSMGAAVALGTPVATIVDTSRLGLVTEVDETDVLLVKPGGTATVELEAVSGVTYPAQVTTVDILPTTSARGGVSYRVRLTLSEGTYPDGTAAPTPRPGMSAMVGLQVRQAADAIAVPAGAVFSANGRDAVWVVRGGKAERVNVTLGVQGDDTIQIVSGVDDGQQIVVGKTDRVHAGQQIG